MLFDGSNQLNGFDVYIMQSDEYANDIINYIYQGYTIEDAFDLAGCDESDLTNLDIEKIYREYRKHNN